MDGDNMLRKMKHYKEACGYKLFDKIYVLDYYDIRETYIIDIFDDYFDDESYYVCKFVKTEYGIYRLETISDSESIARIKLQNKKDNYDKYVTRGY